MKSQVWWANLNSVGKLYRAMKPESNSNLICFLMCHSSAYIQHKSTDIYIPSRKKVFPIQTKFRHDTFLYQHVKFFSLTTRLWRGSFIPSSCSLTNGCKLAGSYRSTERLKSFRMRNMIAGAVGAESVKWDWNATRVTQVQRCNKLSRGESQIHWLAWIAITCFHSYEHASWLNIFWTH